MRCILPLESRFATNFDKEGTENFGAYDFSGLFQELIGKDTNEKSYAENNGEFGGIA